MEIFESYSQVVQLGKNILPELEEEKLAAAVGLLYIHFRALWRTPKHLAYDRQRPIAFAWSAEFEGHVSTWFYDERGPLQVFWRDSSFVRWEVFERILEEHISVPEPTSRLIREKLARQFNLILR